MTKMELFMRIARHPSEVPHRARDLFTRKLNGWSQKKRRIVERRRA